MDKVKRVGVMVRNMMDNILKEKNKDMVLFFS